MKTTDNQSEIFDVVDENDRVIGKTTRKEANNNKKLIHRSVFVAVFNKRGQLYMQQRSATKDSEPLQWTISCSGHVLFGDNYENTASRELVEELGVDLAIEYVNKFVVDYPKEKEMTAMYRTYSDGPFRLHPEEIAQGRFFEKKELLRAIKNKTLRMSISGRAALEKLGWL